MLTLEKAQEIVQKATDAKQPSNTEVISVIESASEPAGDTYSLSEVSRYLKTSETRVRHWEKSFQQLLSSHRNRYNHRVFTNSDVKSLEKIKFLQDTGFYTKQGIVAKLKSKIKDESGGDLSKGDKEYKQKLLLALNTLAAEIKGLRREVREDLQGNLRHEIEHLTMLLFPPPKPKKSWWKLWGK